MSKRLMHETKVFLDFARYRNNKQAEVL